MNQFLLGASIPFIVGALVYAVRRGRIGLPGLIALPLAMAVGVLWAVAPDLPRLVGRNDLYQRLANDPRCDVFFWHYTIDRVESDSSWFAAGFVLLLALLLAAAWRELRLREKGI